MAYRLDKMFQLLKKVLKSRYAALQIESILIEDSLEKGCTVGVAVHNSLNKKTITLHGAGIGTVDAMFDAFKRHFAKQYNSLDTIELYDFNVALIGDSAKSRIRARLAGADALCRVTLVLKNKYSTLFDFEAQTRSLTSSAGICVAKGVEYFINSEEAYRTLQAALDDAKKRNRIDLIRRYTSELSEVVKNTNYEFVLEEDSE